MTFKGGITMDLNEKNELVPMRPVTLWIVCMGLSKNNTWM